MSGWTRHVESIPSAGKMIQKLPTMKWEEKERETEDMMNILIKINPSNYSFSFLSLRRGEKMKEPCYGSEGRVE